MPMSCSQLSFAASAADAAGAGAQGWPAPFALTPEQCRPDAARMGNAARNSNLPAPMAGIYLPTTACSVLAESLAVRASFSQLKGRPSMARFMVFSSTSEKTCR
jgi:hypothetical protein